MISSRRRRRRPEEGDDVNLSPLIDVTFLLLIFFVVTSTFTKDQAVEIERPSAQSRAETHRVTLRVALDAEGNLYLEGAPIRPWTLQRKLRRQIERTGAEDVLIIADRRAGAGELVELVDQCRLAGAAHVAVAAKGEPR